MSDNQTTDEIRSLAIEMMLRGVAVRGVFVIPESLAIQMMHLLPELEQVVNKELWTWGAQLSENYEHPV